MPETLPPPTNRLEIVERTEIAAPAGYVSVYHETTHGALAAIDRQGLSPKAEGRNIGSDSEIERLNQLLDQYCPQHLQAQGVSRVRNTYAYNSLEHGFSLGFAAQRYVRESPAMLRQRYEVLTEYEPATLALMGVKTFGQYKRTIQDPQYLRQAYPGEVLELKVDARHAFVGDLRVFTDIADELAATKGRSEPEVARTYWDSVVSLSDFRQWYALEDNTDGRSPYVKHPEAPAHLPNAIASPEILIPDVVPPSHIRVLA